jgi:hypothetical protein
MPAAAGAAPLRHHRLRRNAWTADNAGDRLVPEHEEEDGEHEEL